MTILAPLRSHRWWSREIIQSFNPKFAPQSPFVVDLKPSETQNPRFQPRHTLFPFSRPWNLVSELSFCFVSSFPGSLPVPVHFDSPVSLGPPSPSLCPPGLLQPHRMWWRAPGVTCKQTASNKTFQPIIAFLSRSHLISQSHSSFLPRYGSRERKP